MTDSNQMEHPVSPSESPAQAAPSNPGEQVPQTDFQTFSEQAPSSVQQASAPQEQPPAAAQTAQPFGQEAQPPVQPAQAAQQGPFQAPPQPNQPNYTTYTPGGYYAPQPPYPPANYQPPYQQNYYNQPAPPPPPPGYPQPPAYPPYPQQKYKPEGLAIACMVLGICSIPLGSLVCAILALVFSSRVKGHYPNGNLGPNTTYVKVGKICGAVGLGISIFAIVLIIVCLILLVTNGTIDYLYNYPYYLNY